jgi:ubiquinone/menaquinone biosynthesis C-methylase UbiE
MCASDKTDWTALVACSGMFDADFYLQSYPDVAEAAVDPLNHYLTHGAAEGRNPSLLFDTALYLQQNPDVAASNVNPLVHYLLHGAAEGRLPQRASTWDAFVSNSMQPPAQDAIILRAHGDLSPPRSPQVIAAPPAEIKLYGESDADHFASGRYDQQHVVAAVEGLGRKVSNMRRILEFGCSNSRILRWFLPLVDSRTELWGVDIDAKRIAWSQQTFAPHINYAVTTEIPHLPFRDDYFDLVYAGSIFTHIDMTYMSWFLEISRVLSEDGLAWISIHDELTVQLMADTPPGKNRFIDKMRAVTRFDEFRTRNWDWIGVGTGLDRNIFFRRDWLVAKLAPVFEVIDVKERTFAGYQTALLLRREGKSKAARAATAPGNTAPKAI